MPMMRGGDLRAELDDPDRVVVLVDRKPRHDRDADARAGKALDDAVLVGAEDEMRLGARLPGAARRAISVARQVR